MEREISTERLSREQLLQELAFVADHFRALGEESGTVLFGWAWGESYPDGGWQDLVVPLASLSAHVQTVEASGLGEIGDDDLFVRIVSRHVEFRFCHESDLHLTFAEPSAVSDYFYSHGEAAGFFPVEQLLGNPGEPPVVIRSTWRA